MIRFLLLVIYSLMCILVLYYITAIIHLFTPVFGKFVDWKKCILIPFYGWIQWFKGPQFF